jgi:hypothetical protein
MLVKVELKHPAGREGKDQTQQEVRVRQTKEEHIRMEIYMVVGEEEGTTEEVQEHTPMETRWEVVAGVRDTFIVEFYVEALLEDLAKLRQWLMTPTEHKIVITKVLVEEPTKVLGVAMV